MLYTYPIVCHWQRKIVYDFLEKMNKNDNQAWQNLKINMLFYTLKNQFKPKWLKHTAEHLIQSKCVLFEHRILPTTNLSKCMPIQLIPL